MFPGFEHMGRISAMQRFLLTSWILRYYDRVFFDMI